jgi:Domain of unknown function (DUF4166)
MTAALYRRLLGAEFDVLPVRVRELHDLTGKAVWIGRADVERGRSFIVRLIAMLFRLPPAGRDVPVRVTFVAEDGQERWTRTFGRHAFRSMQFASGGLLTERIGASSLASALVASPEGLALDLRRFRLLGVPLPRILTPRVRTFESERLGRYQFQAEAHLPMFGLLVRYAGWLEKDAGRSNT